MVFYRAGAREARAVPPDIMTLTLASIEANFPRGRNVKESRDFRLHTWKRVYWYV